MSGRVAVSDQGAVRTIAMLCPERVTALTDDMYLVLADAIGSAQHDVVIRCIVVTGRFDIFTVGSANEHAVPEATRQQDVAKFLKAIADNAKPIIAAVEGVAAGIGTAMVFYCDQVIAAASATFASPLESHDLVPDGATGLLLPTRLAHQRAFAMLVLGRSMSVQKARDAGLIDIIVPPGRAAIEAERIAQQVCRLPPDRVADIRELLTLSAEDVLRRLAEEDRQHD